LPALIPQVDLTFAWESSHGNGSTPMVYDPFSSIWQTACSGYGSDELYTLACGGGIIRLNWSVFNTPGDCPDLGTIANCDVPISLVTITESPFKLVLSNMHDWCGHLAESLGYSKFTVTGPASTDAGCCIPFNVNGCNGLPLGNSGITVKSGASIIAGGTTSTLPPLIGQVAIDVATTGTYDIVVTNASRFTSTTFTDVTLACNTLASFDMSSSIASGFHCLAGCAQPVKDTLHATFSVAGAMSLSWSGSAWTISIGISGHTYVVTLNQDGSMTITRDGTDCGAVTLTVTSCPPSFAGNISVAGGACATELGSTGSISE
jgi:hypothetical protein